MSDDRLTSLVALKALLNEFLDRTRRRFHEHVAQDPQGDPAVTHEQAEDILLKIVDDPELTQLWEDASDQWWYA